MKNTKSSYFQIMQSPAGELVLVASDEALHAVWFDSKNSFVKNQISDLEEKPNHPILKETAKQLTEYFAGKRKDFDLPLSPDGTSFQKKAWSALLKIPYGKTISYQAQAKKLGDLKKARAVGTANSKNPIPIIVPCHRVIAKSGSLSGYAGGVHVKTFLLTHEQKFLA